jgi:hypothetical protein
LIANKEPRPRRAMELNAQSCFEIGRSRSRTKRSISLGESDHQVDCNQQLQKGGPPGLGQRPVYPAVSRGV